LFQCFGRSHLQARGCMKPKILTGIGRNTLQKNAVCDAHWRCCKTCKSSASCRVPQIGVMVKGPAPQSVWATSVPTTSRGKGRFQGVAT
jgi:hypothetical protein